jgi:protein-L-isoaspartate(D-aspartate) O-methyltransferase
MTEEEDKRRIGIAHLILRLRRIGITDQRVLGAIESVPRDVFVPAESRAEAYAERALPIDCGQTISAPVIVGIMTAALDLGDRDRVLEIGTGTGYQSAILSKLCRRVYTIDRFRTLVSAAESRFRTLRITNITTLVGDGTRGWPEQAPFDRILLSAAIPEVPPILIEQLKLGGVLIAPVGNVPKPDAWEPLESISQQLTKMIRTETGVREEVLIPVLFVKAFLPDTTALNTPGLRLGQRKHLRRGAAVIGDVLRLRANLQRGSLNQVMHGQHHLAYVNRILSDEPVAPIVNGLSKLRGPGRQLCYVPVRAKTKIGAANHDPRPLRVFGGCNRHSSRASIAIDPVVQVQPRVGNAALRRSGEETGVETT